MSKSNRKYILATREVLSTWCTACEVKRFLPLTRIRVVGALLILIAPLLAVMFPHGLAVFVFMMAFVFSSVWLGFLVFILKALFSDVTGIVDILKRLPLILGTLPFIGALGVFVWLMFTDLFPSLSLPDGYVGAFLMSVLIWLGASLLLPRRTSEGQERLAQAKGLAMYLGTAERDRFAELYPPTESVEHFEELLPYALALDKSKTWANRFERFLSEAGMEADAFGDTSWRDMRDFRFSATKSMVANTTSKGRSGSGYSGSGSSGGGSSGRGSGGGGGGGW